MQATKVIVETDARGEIKDLPSLPPSTRIEVIFLIPETPVRANRREPPAEIAGKGRILGDITAPVCAAEDWEMLQ
jgi:hypothetical protein